jgi:hypothetical protein
MKLCESFTPNKYYSHPSNYLCVRQYCANYIGERRECIKVDPAGCDYEIIEAYCKLSGRKI